jgi:hypothetical protein
MRSDCARLGKIFVLVAIAVGASACSASLPRPISGVVRELGGPECPEERIFVVDSRSVDHDTVYVLDACGTPMEVEHGLALPARGSEVSELSPETPFEEPGATQLAVPADVVAVVRDKVRRWCTLDGAGGAGARESGALVFPSATPAEQKACQDNLSRAVVALGMEEEAADSWVYRFRLYRFLFTVREAIYLAPCEHRVSDASRRACQCESGADEGCRDDDRAAKQVSVDSIKSGAEGDGEDGLRKERSWFGSVQLGLGFLANDAPGRAAQSISLHTRAEAGFKLTPSFGLAFVTGHDMGLEVSVDRPVLVEIGLGGVLYPVAESGFRFDATVAAAPFWYDFESASAGALFGGGVGYYPRERTKKDSWTSFSLALRGFYSLGEERRTIGGMLQGGMHVW